MTKLPETLADRLTATEALLQRYRIALDIPAMPGEQDFFKCLILNQIAIMRALRDLQAK